jgi:hypothetical protein
VELAEDDAQMTEDQEIVNLDDCPPKPALLAGAAVSFILTLFPLSYALCCLPLVIGGFVATATYIIKYSIRIELKVGMKLAILSCLAGFGASTALYDILWAATDYRIGLNWYVELLGSLADSAPESSRDQLLESIDLLKSQKIGLGVVLQQALTVVVTSGIGGGMGGALASSLFKKGSLAQ